MLTVLFATFNGAHTLPRMLDSLTRLESPPGGWKLVVVDNASRDATKAIIEQYADKLPLTYAYEGKQGKNAALNRGLEYVDGDLVVLTDDDVLPQPDWLCVWRAVADATPQCSIFGGAIEPEWELVPEDAICEGLPLGPLYGLTDPAWKEGEISAHCVWGANMVVRTEVFDAGYRFDLAVGPNGTASYVMGSETEFVARLAREGHRCFHCPRAVVRHIIRPHQVTRSWIRARAVRYGKAAWPYHFAERPNCARVLGYPRYLLRAAATQALKASRAVIFGTAAESLREQWRFYYLIGQLKEGRSR